VPAVDCQQVFQKLFPENLVSPLAQVFGSGGSQNLTAVTGECESDLGMSQSVMREQIGEMKTLSRF
jgi:hypothetical protein